MRWGRQRDPEKIFKNIVSKNSANTRIFTFGYWSAVFTITSFQRCSDTQVRWRVRALAHA